jgi:hypothetical protein
MSRAGKLKDKLRGDGSFTWSELISLLNKLGWETRQGSGSRVKFAKEIDGITHLINLHKPHPGNETRQYMRGQVIEKLEMAGDL